MSKIRKMKKISYSLIILFLITSCGGVKDAGKVLRNEKIYSSDEFPVKKREPLVLPPDYNKIPVPNSEVQNKDSYDENRIKKILKDTEGTNSSQNSKSSTEESILNRIKK